MTDKKPSWWREPLHSRRAMEVRQEMRGMLLVNAPRRGVRGLGKVVEEMRKSGFLKRKALAKARAQAKETALI